MVNASPQAPAGSNGWVRTASQGHRGFVTVGVEFGGSAEVLEIAAGLGEDILAFHVQIRAEREFEPPPACKPLPDLDNLKPSIRLPTPS